ncbi:hypothetical protein FRX31_010695 [Thalictrum thalictroides]|uniref:Uncharacterized protein n=1 Tax=Thalictrum thalictroides TaxID=46969 RepID=A0A7J6WSW3_THATH|nr:hypothetical protein FRX31_010695 [Thalictrum thalictroides]
MVFDYDLNLKRSNEYSFLRDSAFNMTESHNSKELFAVAGYPPECHKFDQSTLDWCYSNVRILIGFTNQFYRCTSIGFMVRDKWDEVFIQVKNLKNNHGCRLTVKGKQVLVDLGDHYNQTWLDL